MSHEILEKVKEFCSSINASSVHDKLDAVHEKLDAVLARIQKIDSAIEQKCPQAEAPAQAAPEAPQE